MNDQLYKAHAEYVTEVTRLMVFHIWDLDRRGSMSVSQGLDEVVWLYRLTTLANDKRPVQEGFDNPAWMEMKAKLMGVIEGCKSLEDTAAMEEICLDMLMPYLEPKFEKGARKAEGDFHCWGWGVKDNDTLVHVHIVNADKPESPFSDIKRFASDLLCALEDAQSKYPNARSVECQSWMNSMPKFLQIWPKSFHDNRTNIQPTGGNGPGRWGQYMNAAGGFNHKLGEILRTTGEHKYPKSRGCCPLQDAIDHLREFTAD